MKRKVNTTEAVQAIGPYSQAIISNGMVFCSGQIALTVGGELVRGGIKEQTKQVLNNLKVVLKAAQSSLQDVVKTTVYLSSMNDFTEMNEVYTKFFSENKPARSTVEVSKLPKNVLVEIDCIAEHPEGIALRLA